MQYLWLLQQINWWYFTINHICTNDDNKDTILPLTFWSTKRSCTSDKIHLQQTKFKYCGANVNINGWETNASPYSCWLIHSPQQLKVLIDTSSVRSITPMNMTSRLEEQEQLLLMSPIQMYDEDESFTGDIRDCSINKLNMILNTSVTDLKMHITSANRMTDASIQTRDTEYADMGVQVCS